MSTEIENKRFGVHRKTGVDIKRRKKPTRGRLIYMHGSEERVLYQNEPFGFLQFIKKQLIQVNGYNPLTLKIKY
jgi:hypothetical protein